MSDIGRRPAGARWLLSVAALCGIAASSWRQPVRAQGANGVADLRARIVARLNADAAMVEAAIASIQIADDQRASLRARLQEARSGIASIAAPESARFTTVLPLNELHTGILAVHGAALAAAGLPPLRVWKAHRYDAVPFIAPPTLADDAHSVDLAVMRGEYRADSILLTNATDRPAEVAVGIAGVPGAPRPDWLRVAAVEWTDTQGGQPVADGLPDAAFEGGAYRLSVPAGITRKIWLTADGSRIAPGAYRGSMILRSAASTVEVPLNVRVSTVTMGRPRLSLGAWDYTNGAGAYGITAQNRAAAIASMQSHFVDSPWANRSALPWPASSDYDSEGRLARALDFKALDDWIALWPGARRYYVFVAAGATFAGAAMGTPEFAARLSVWGRALAQHVNALRIKPRRLALLLVDEPQTADQLAILSAWARVLKAAAPDIDLFEEPTSAGPDVSMASEAFALADELCLHLGVYSRGGQAFARHFEARRSAGQRLWLYQTTGPARTLDPTRYYRMQAWYAFRIGAIGEAIWSFGDTGGALTSWNDYSATRQAYAPAFVGREDVTDSVHWQAVREGLEDYEYLAMLRDAAQRATDAAWKERALALVREAIVELPGPYTGEFPWDRDPLHARPDEYRLRILALLESGPR